jgi:hypothetical protein
MDENDIRILMLVLRDILEEMESIKLLLKEIILTKEK